MRKIAPELNQLMWYLAEKGETRSVEEFEQRYPELRYELANRIAMVRKIRGEKAGQSRTQEIPPFKPVYVRRVPPSKRTVVAISAVCFAALAMATYTTVILTQPPVREVRMPVDLPQSFPDIEREQAPSKAEVVPPVVNPQPEPLAPPPPPKDETPEYLKPQELKLDGAPLTTALRLVAAQGGLSVTIAPGMPDPTVKLSYKGMNTIEMLQDLGRQYAFTAFDQGDGTILVIPAVDPAAAKDKAVVPADKDVHDEPSSGVK